MNMQITYKRNVSTVFTSDVEYSDSTNPIHSNTEWNSFIKTCLLVKTQILKTLFCIKGTYEPHNFSYRTRNICDSEESTLTAQTIFMFR